MVHKKWTLLGVVTVVTFADRCHCESGSKLRGTNAVYDVGEEVGEVEFGNPNPPVDTGPSIGGSVPLAEKMIADSEAHLMGAWSSVESWPIVPIHAILLRDGNVLTYGTGPVPADASGFHYDVWDPRTNSHHTLNITTDTNIFCSGQANLPNTGEVLILGGDLYRAGNEADKNAGHNDTLLFNPSDKTLRRGTRAMKFSRWYPALTVLGSGNVLVQGGRNAGRGPTLTPELYNTTSETWEQLTSATSAEVYGGLRWWYPKTYLASDGSVVVVPPSDNIIWNFMPQQNEIFHKVGYFDGKNVTESSPSVMYDKDKVLMFQDAEDVSIMDIKDPKQPNVTRTQSLSQRRRWATAVALPDGKVLLVGGTSQLNREQNAVKYAEIWNPSTGQWSIGASAEKSRLYHSTALLLPNGLVFTGGGGPPGQVVNQNAEIYYPPYLFKKDGSGDLAPRPKIQQKMGGWTVEYNEKLVLNLMETTSAISRVSLIRLGSVTHSYNTEERMEQLSFEETSNELAIQIPESPNGTPPGYYMIFVVDSDGVPSESIIVKLVL